MISGQGKMETSETGCKRESNSGRGRFDLIPYEAIEALAKWYEDGAVKYGDRNWEKGISVKDCINRMIRHAIKAGNGWTDEDHLSAVMWNAAAAITMIQRRPDLNDHIWKVEEDVVASIEATNDDLVADNNKIINVCNSLNALCGDAKYRYLRTKDKREETLESIMYQAQVVIWILQERLENFETSKDA